VFRYHLLNLSLLGVSGATSIPAIPFHLSELPDTILKLLRRRAQAEQAANGLSTVWTIGDYTETANTFMGMDGTVGSDDPRTRLALDKPDQYAMSWTTLGGIYENATRDWLGQFAATLVDPAEATRHGAVRRRIRRSGSAGADHSMGIEYRDVRAIRSRCCCRG
jgi:hypothetical protein